MATVVKDFKIKSGLVVEGTTGTINNFDILTKKEADQTYITNLVGGTGTAENTANTLVKRDADGNFAAGDITVNELSIGEIGRIYDDSELLIAASTGEDIKLTADDIRLESVDDIRMTAQGDILLDASEPGMGVYVGSISTGNTVVTEAIMDSHIGDNTVDGTTGNTITDRIASASQDLTDHENATEAHGATGAVVGTTNEQTLTNKTISYTDNTLTVQVANVSDLTATASELNVLDGITASTSELNILDGVTATASELNLLDGVTATTAELNYVDGVTSSIQNQLDDKAPLESPALTGTPTAPTAAAGTNSTQVATTAYADAAVAALVDGAPELLNTLNELAAALDDNPDVISDLQDIAAGKQDELTAGANIDITGATISVTGLDTDDVAEGSNQYFLDTRAVDAISAALGDGIEYVGGAFDVQVGSGLEIGGGTGNEVVIDRDTVDTWYDANGAAAQALSDAEDYADGLAGNYEAAGTAQGLIDLLDTDDIEEGSTNLYFEDSRAKASAASLLTGATLTNITITGDETGLVITAENGVDESTTNDLAEGTGEGANLYFTDERAVDALQGTDSMFSTVSIDEVALQVASTLTAEATGIQTAYAWAKADYRSAEFLVKVAYSTHTEISKVLLTLDTSDNIAITEYGIVGTNGSASTVSAGISGTDVQLLVTTANVNSTVTVVGTLLA